jgi:hypothetical protein
LRTYKNKVKREFILASILFLCFISKTYGFEFSLKLAGGLSFVNPANINHIRQGWEELYKIDADEHQNWSFIEGEIGSLKNSFDFEGEFVYTLHPRIAISIGTGFIFSELNPDKPNFSIKKNISTYEYIYPMKVSAMPVILSGYYFYPLNNRFKVYAKAGAGFIWAKYIDREGKKQFDKDKYGYYSSQNTKARGSMLSGALGLIIESEQGINFFIESSFRKTNISNFTGENKSGLIGTLYFFDEFNSDLEFWQPKLQILTQEPAGDSFRAVKKAEIDLSGFSVKLGIIINF